MKRINNFTLGNFKDLIGYKEKPMSEIKPSEFLSKRQKYQNNETTRTYVIDQNMLKYLKEELFDLNKFDRQADIEEKIIDYMKELCEIIDSINRTYRNPAAHEISMSIKDAETVINQLLFSKKIMFRFFEKIKISNMGQLK